MSKSGLASGSSNSSVGHSNKNSQKHKDDVAKQIAAGRAKVNTIAVPVSGVKPAPLMAKGDLECDELDLGFEISPTGEIINKSSNDIQKEQSKLISDVLKHGIFRPSGRKKKDGSDYLRKMPKRTAKDVMQRRTFVVSPEVSLLYKQMPPKLKKQMLAIVTKQVHKAAKKRWPDADLRYMQVHDDTEHLHVDLWALKGKMVKHKPRGGEAVDVLQFQASLFAEKGAGPGAVFLDRKKRLRGRLHGEDEKKLKLALDSYSKRVKSTKKEMSATPSDIDYARDIDTALAGVLKKYFPDHLKQAVSKYSKHCDQMDSHNYGTLDDISKKTETLNKKQQSLINKETELGVTASELIDQKTNLDKTKQNLESEKTEIAETKTELSKKAMGIIKAEVAQNKRSNELDKRESKVDKLEVRMTEHKALKSLESMVAGLLWQRGKFFDNLLKTPKMLKTVKAAFSRSSDASIQKLGESLGKCPSCGNVSCQCSPT